MFTELSGLGRLVGGLGKSRYVYNDFVFGRVMQLRAGYARYV